MVANKIDDHPSKCLEVSIDVRRGTPQRFFLIPVTPTTMPTPQSPLCVMLNEALSAPNAVHWAWPPVSNVETPFTGVADDRVVLTEGSQAVPNFEQTFEHALPRPCAERQDKGEARTAAVELGHLLSFVAVEYPVDSPIGRGQPREDTSIFFDFSAEWLESIYKTEGSAVVGYFRYLNLLDLPSPGDHAASPAAITRAAAPIVSVIDHYLFKDFCYEARAFMFLEAVSFYCKRFANLYGDRCKGNLPKQSHLHRSFASPILMRCRSMNLPILRMFQKLYRVHVREAADPRLQVIHLTECGNGEVLHVHLSPELVDRVAANLSDKVSLTGKGKFYGIACTVKLDKGLTLPTPTPFDAIIESHRERWLAENAPFRKHTCKSSRSDGEEGDPQCHNESHRRPLSLPVFCRRPAYAGGALVENFSNSSISSANVSTSSLRDSSAPGSSVGYPEDTSSSTSFSVGPDADVPQARETSGTLQQTIAVSPQLNHIQPAPLTYERSSQESQVFSHRGNFRNSFGAHPSWSGCVDFAFLQLGTPIQVNNGDGQWICGYWLESCRQLTLHWFDPTRSENALLQHYGPIWIRDLAGVNHFVTPTSTEKVYIAVAPHVRVLPLPYLDGESVEVSTLFERRIAVAAY